MVSLRFAVIGVCARVPIFQRLRRTAWWVGQDKGRDVGEVLGEMNTFAQKTHAH